MKTGQLLVVRETITVLLYTLWNTSTLKNQQYEILQSQGINESRYDMLPYNLLKGTKVILLNIINHVSKY